MNQTTLRVERPSILLEIQGKRCLVIEAHAGTGKTYTIEHLVVDFLVNPEQNYLIKDILIVTFTDKAARELRTRVRKMIEKILHNPDPSCDETTPHWTIDEAARTRLQLALFAFEEAQISTIHGFCQRVLRDTAFLSGGALERTLGSTRALFEKAFAELLREQFAYNEPHKTHLGVWLETYTLDELKSLLFEALSTNALKQGLLKPVSLSTTFNHEQFSQETLALYKTIVSNRQNFPSHANRALRNLIVSIFLTEKAKVNGNSGGDAYFDAIAEFENSESCFWKTGKTDLAAMLRFVRDAIPNVQKLIKDLETTLAALESKASPEFQRIVPVLEPHFDFLRERFPSFKNILLEALLPALHARVDKLKNEQGIFDFEDLLTEVEMSLRNNSNGVCALLRDRYKLALIDEFQDTDPVQWTIFKTVFADSENHRLLVVGDPKQSIYRFRGADVQTYLEATSKLPSLKLTRNFRSSKKIIDAYNIILSAKGTFFQSGGINYKTPVSCGDTKASITNHDGSPIEQPVKLVHLVPTTSEGWKSEAYKQSLLRFIASEIRVLLAPNGPRIVSQKRPQPEPLRAKDIFVLTSSNSEAANVARVLRKSGIPCTTFQNGSVFASPEAQEIVCLMDAIAEPANHSLVARACLGPFFEWRLENIDAILANENGEPWGSLRRWHEMTKRENLSRLFETILRETGLLRREIVTSQSERTITNTLHIFEVMQRWHTMENANFEECRQRLKQATSEGGSDAEAENMQRLETDAHAVQILTMHKSKGLEAAVVFFYGGFGSSPQKNPQLVQDINRNRVFDTREIPHYEDIIAEQEAQENERLLYVAVTRVGALLYLPFFEKSMQTEKGPQFELNLTGRYRKLAERIHRLADTQNAASCEPAERETFAKLAQVIRPPVKGSLLDTAPTETASTPECLLNNFNAFPNNSDNAPNFAELRLKHAAPGARSYTSLKKAGVAATRKFDETDANSGDTHAPQTPLPQSDLPGGATFGVCFHEAMEKLDLALVASASDFDAWISQPSNSEFISKILASHGFSVLLNNKFAAMVFQSAHAACSIADTEFMGLAKASNLIRETRFHMPWPEHSHVPESANFKAERGFLVGAIDAIFEWNGKFFILDWKTDRLASYDQQSCEQHMREHYHLQAQIYTLALARFLNVHQESDFERLVGGHVYVFARAPSPVAVGARIGWNEFVEFQSRLKNARGLSLAPEENT